MSIIQLKHLSEICMILGMIMLIIAGIFFVKFDVYKAWHFVTGRRLKERPFGNHASNITKIINKRNEQVVDTTVQTNVDYTVETTESQEETVRLQPQDMPDYTEKDTMLLEPSEEIFSIIYEITYIHASEIDI